MSPVHPVAKRAASCAAAGLLAAAALAEWAARYRHSGRQAVTTAAGQHLSAANVRADGILVTAAVVAVVLFVIATIAARRRESASTRRGPARTVPGSWRGAR